MKFNLLHRYPFLRLLPFLAAGIVCGDLFYFEQERVSLPFIKLSITLLLVVLIAIHRLRRYSARGIFGIVASATVFLGGLAISTYQLKQVNTNFPKEEAVYQATITSAPLEKERSVQATADIIQQRTTGAVPFSAKAVLFFHKDINALSLCKGNILILSCKLSKPQDDGNPDSFDYAKYLHRKGFGGSGFVRQERWKIIGHKTSDSFSDKALKYRERILQLYHSFGWEKEVEGVIAALTVGYKDDLSESIRETYSVTGASHVLALSGLHIGFLYGLLLFILKPLGKSRRAEMIRSAIIILLLRAFAFFTGLSPSVIRSVIMCSLFVTAHSLQRNK